MSHTPGPWVVGGIIAWRNQVRDQHDRIVATVKGGSEIETYHNASLIAEAPRMLTVLEMVLKETDDAEWISYMSPIVARAKGKVG